MTAVKIHVTDASDRAPRFKEHIYTARLSEDAVKGSLVAEVEALHVVGHKVSCSFLRKLSLNLSSKANHESLHGSTHSDIEEFADVKFENVESKMKVVYLIYFYGQIPN